MIDPAPKRDNGESSGLEDAVIKPRRRRVVSELGRGLLQWLAPEVSRRLKQAIVAGLLVGPFLYLGWKYSISTPDDLERRVAATQLAPAPGTRFTIVVADLEGDSALQNTTDLVDVLMGIDGIAVFREPGALRVGTVGDAGAALDSAYAHGRALLARRHGDVLVWGRVSGGNLRLRVQSRDASAGQPVWLSTFALSRAMPDSLRDVLGLQIVGVTLAQARPATEAQGTYLTQKLWSIASKLLLLGPSPPFPAEQRAWLQYSFGLVAATLGYQSDQPGWLDVAVMQQERALEVWNKEQAPLEWAMTQDLLGSSLRQLGELKGGVDYLERAASAYRSALEIVDGSAVNRAMSTRNLGVTLMILGERGGHTDILWESVAAFRSALEVFTAEGTPDAWAMTMTDLGGALSRLAEQRGDTALANEGVRAHREALEVWTLTDEPVFWATAQNNLAGALLSLDHVDPSIAHAEAAVEAYRLALSGLRRSDMPMQWARGQMNLGTALSTLGERMGGPGLTHMDSAVVAFRAALEVATRERSDRLWAMIQHNLATVLKLMGERKNSVVVLEDAASAYRRALEERTTEVSPPEWTQSTVGLAETLAAIGMREDGVGRLEEAVACLDSVLEVHDSTDADALVTSATRWKASLEALITQRRARLPSGVPQWVGPDG